MGDLDDFRLGEPPERKDGEREPVVPPPRFPRGLVAGLVLTLAALAGLGYLAFRRLAARPPAVKDSAGETSRLATPSPSPSASIVLPPLDQSDALVRELAKGLSSHPQVVAWLATPALVRTSAAVVEKVAADEPPRALLGFLAPKEGFGVARKQGRTVIDPRSYDRYNAFADAVASLDAAGCARVYRLLEPLFEAAYRDLGHPQGGFSRILARALTTLQETPVLDGDVPVRPVARAVVVYEFADPDLEILSPAQKHLLRMGSGNVRKVQAKLRELEGALGFRQAR